MRASIAILATLISPWALAAEKPVILHEGPTDEERPLIAEVHAGPQGSDFAFEIRFDQLPWGDQCKARCANATLFVDLDDSTATGLQLGPKAKETGADLAVTVQGMREFLELGARSYLRVRVRQLTKGEASMDDGAIVADLDHRRDPERLQTDGDTVWTLVDMTSLNLPAGKKARVIYHPPGAAALQGTTRGMLAGSASRATIFKNSKPARASGKKRKTGGK